MEDKTALLFFTLYIFLWNFLPKPRPREKEPSQSWPTKLGSPRIARVEFSGESLRQVLIYLPNCAIAMRKKSELRQHREHGRKQPKSIKIHQMGFKAYHFVFQCAIRSKSTEIPNVQKFLNCGGFRKIYLSHLFSVIVSLKPPFTQNGFFPWCSYDFPMNFQAKHLHLAWIFPWLSHNLLHISADLRKFCHAKAAAPDESLGAQLSQGVDENVGLDFDLRPNKSHI